MKEPRRLIVYRCKNGHISFGSYPPSEDKPYHCNTKGCGLDLTKGEIIGDSAHPEEYPDVIFKLEGTLPWDHESPMVVAYFRRACDCGEVLYEPWHDGKIQPQKCKCATPQGLARAQAVDMVRTLIKAYGITMGELR